MNQFDIYSLFQRLDDGLKQTKPVPDGDGLNIRQLAANEFIFIEAEKGIAKFKHGCSKNWAFLKIASGKVELKSVENWPDPRKVWEEEARSIPEEEDLLDYLQRLKAENEILRKKKGLK